MESGRKNEVTLSKTLSSVDESGGEAGVARNSLTIEPVVMATGKDTQVNRFTVDDNKLADASMESKTLPAFGGELQPGIYQPKKTIANPAPLGLSAFALTTFVLSLINLGAGGVYEPNLVVALALAYGGLIQLLAGMWEMAVGNTFGATALSSYGGFWLSFAVILTPGFDIVSQLEADGGGAFMNSFGFFLLGWTIFTTLLVLCTLKSTVAFFSLFLALDMAFVCLTAGYLSFDGAGPNQNCVKAGGAFGLVAAILAWYNALAGIANSSNSIFVVPVAHFPWSDKGREPRNTVENGAV